MTDDDLTKVEDELLDSTAVIAAIENEITFAEQEADITDGFCKHTAKDFEKAVKGAQADDPIAVRNLYNWFRWLIRSIANRECIRCSLGEDAENIAWVLFYELIQECNLKDYSRIPKYIKKNLTWRMVDAAKSRKYYDPYATTDLMELETTALENYWEDNINSIALKTYLKELKPIQQKVIKLLFFYDYSRTEIAKILNIKLTAVKFHLQQGKKELRRRFGVEGGDS